MIARARDSGEEQKEEGRPGDELLTVRGRSMVPWRRDQEERDYDGGQGRLAAARKKSSAGIEVVDILQS
eukprot:753248-Hanusia_phi.AAC.1